MLNAKDQVLEGAIIVDDISTLALHLENSAYVGAINETGDAGKVTVTLDATSAWTLTADTYITAFDGDIANVNANGYTLYVNGEAVTQ